MDPEQLQRAIERIDRYNADDPNRHRDEPLALLQGRLAHQWVLRLDPGSSPPLQLAARAHHIGRWELPRDAYPTGRAGYLRWRRDQKRRHAERLSACLAAVDVAESDRDRAAAIVQKHGLGSDPEVQVFEDAVCLTFLETQFVTTAEKVDDDDKMVAVVAKTLRKMSPAAHRAAASVDLDARTARIVERATAEPATD